MGICTTKENDSELIELKNTENKFGKMVVSHVLPIGRAEAMQPAPIARSYTLPEN